jgi:hypothetical protein
MGRQNYEQAGKKTDQIVVIQVGGLIQQFDVREAQKEEYRANPIENAECNAKSEHHKGNEMGVHERIGPGPDPLEARVGKMKRRGQIEFADPTFGHESDHCAGHHQAEQEPKRRQGGDIDGREKGLREA